VDQSSPSFLLNVGLNAVVHQVFRFYISSFISKIIALKVERCPKSRQI